VLTWLSQAVLTWLGVGDIAGNEASDADSDTSQDGALGQAGRAATGPPQYQPPAARPAPPADLDGSLPRSVALALAHQARGPAPPRGARLPPSQPAPRHAAGTGRLSEGRRGASPRASLAALPALPQRWPAALLLLAPAPRWPIRCPLMRMTPWHT